MSPGVAVAAMLFIDTIGLHIDSELQSVDVEALSVISVRAAPLANSAGSVGFTVTGSPGVGIALGEFSNIVDRGSDVVSQSDNAVATSKHAGESDRLIDHAGEVPGVVPLGAVATSEGLGAGDSVAADDGAGSDHLIVGAGIECTGEGVLTNSAEVEGLVGFGPLEGGLVVADVDIIQSVVVVHQGNGEVDDAVASAGDIVMESLVDNLGASEGLLQGGVVEAVVSINHQCAAAHEELDGIGVEDSTVDGELQAVDLTGLIVSVERVAVDQRIVVGDIAVEGAAFGFLVGDGTIDVAVTNVFIVISQSVLPRVLTADASDHNGNNLVVVQNHMEVSNTVATIYGGQVEVDRTIVGSGEELTVETEVVAKHSSVERCSLIVEAVVDGEVDGDSTVATIDSSEALAYFAGGVVGNTIPYKLVATCAVGGDIVTFLDGELQGVNIPAIASLGQLILEGIDHALGVAALTIPSVGGKLALALDCFIDVVLGVNYSEGQVDNTVAGDTVDDRGGLIGVIASTPGAVPLDTVASGQGDILNQFGVADALGGHNHLLGSTFVLDIVDVEDLANSLTGSGGVIVAVVLDSVHGVVVVLEVEGVVVDTVAVVAADRIVVLVQSVEETIHILLGGLLGSEVERVFVDHDVAIVIEAAHQHIFGSVFDISLLEGQLQDIGAVDRTIGLVGVELRILVDVDESAVSGTLLVVDDRIDTLTSRHPSVGLAVTPGVVTAVDNHLFIEGAVVDDEVQAIGAVAMVGGATLEEGHDGAIERSNVEYIIISIGTAVLNILIILHNRVVNGDVQGHDAVAAVDAGEGMVGNSALGVGTDSSIAVLPLVAVASNDIVGDIVDRVDGEGQGDDAVATLAVGSGVGVLAALGVGSAVDNHILVLAACSVVAVDGPSVLAASLITNGASVAVVEGQSQSNGAVATIDIGGEPIIVAILVVGLAVAGRPGVAVADISNGDSLGGVAVDSVVHHSVVATTVGALIDAVVVAFAKDGIDIKAVLGGEGHLVFADNDGLSHGQVQHNNAVALVCSRSYIVDTVHTLGIGAAVNPRVVFVGQHILVNKLTLLDNVTEDSHRVAASDNRLTGGHAVVDITIAVGDTLVGEAAALDNLFDTVSLVIVAQVEGSDTVATVGFAHVGHLVGVVTEFGELMAIGIPSVGLANTHDEVHVQRGIDSIVDSDKAVAAGGGGPVGGLGAAIRLTVEGHNVQLNALFSIVGVHIGVSVVRELALAEHRLVNNIVDGVDGQHEGAVDGATGGVLRGGGHGVFVLASLKIAGNGAPVADRIFCSTLADGVGDGHLGRILGGEAQHLDDVAAKLVLHLLRQDSVAGDDVRKLGVAILGIPGVRHALAHANGLVLRVADGKVDTGPLVAASLGVAGAALDLTTFTNVLAHEAALAGLVVEGHNIEEEVVALGAVDPRQSIGDGVQHQAQDGDAVATGDIGLVELLGDVGFGSNGSVVGYTVDPGEAPVGGHAVEVGTIGGVVNSEVQGDGGVAAVHVGTLEGEGGGIVALGVGHTVNPGVLVAAGLLVDTFILIVHREGEGDDTVATVDGGESLLVVAALGVLVTGEGPCVCVAHSHGNGGSLDGIDRQVLHLVHRAGVAVVNVADLGKLGSGGIGGAAPVELGALAVLSKAVLRGHGFDAEGQVHGAVAAVDAGEGVVVLTLAVDGVVTPSDGEHLLASAALGVDIIDGIDSDVGSGELVDAVVLVGHRQGVGTADGGIELDHSGVVTGVPAVAVVGVLGGSQCQGATGAESSGAGAQLDHGQSVDRHSLLGGNLAVGGLGGSGDSVGSRLCGRHGDAGAGLAVAPAVGGGHIIGVADGERDALAGADLGIAADAQGGHRRGVDGQRGGQRSAVVGVVGGNEGVDVGSIGGLHSDGAVGELVVVVPHIAHTGHVATGNELESLALAVVVDGVLGAAVDGGHGGGVHLQREVDDRVGAGDRVQGHHGVGGGGELLGGGAVGHGVDIALANLVRDFDNIVRIQGQVQRISDTVAVGDVLDHMLVRAVGSVGNNGVLDRVVDQGTLGVVGVGLAEVSAGDSPGIGGVGLHLFSCRFGNSRADIANLRIVGSKVDGVGVVVQEHHGDGAVVDPVIALGVGEGEAVVIGGRSCSAGQSSLSGAGLAHAIVEADTGGSCVAPAIAAVEADHLARLGGILVDAQEHLLGLGFIAQVQGLHAEYIVGVGGHAGDGGGGAVNHSGGSSLGGEDLTVQHNTVGLGAVVALVGLPSQGGAGGGDVLSRQGGGGESSGLGGEGDDLGLLAVVEGADALTLHLISLSGLQVLNGSGGLVGRDGYPLASGNRSADGQIVDMQVIVSIAGNCRFAIESNLNSLACVGGKVDIYILTSKRDVVINIIGTTIVPLAQDVPLVVGISQDDETVIIASAGGCTRTTISGEGKVKVKGCAVWQNDFGRNQPAITGCSVNVDPGMVIEDAVVGTKGPL